MKEGTTTQGKNYAVTSPNGCTVTTEDGLTLAEVEAGKQGYFVAVSGKVELSDDAAVLTQVFKLAPCQKLRLLGVVGGNTGGGLPAGFTRVAYLMSTGTQRIYGTTTQPISNQHLELCAQAALPGNPAVSETAVSSTVFALQDFTLWVPYKYDVELLNIRWDFPGDGAGQHYTEYDGVYEFSTYKKREGDCYINGKLVLSKLSNSTESTRFGLFARITGGSSFNRGGQIAWVKVGDEGHEKLHLVAAINENGSPCMYDLVSKTAYSNSGTGAFVAGVDTQSQLNAVLRRLPDLTGQDGRELHLCLADSLYEAAVASGIIEAAATSKNWQIAYDPTTKIA